MKTFKIKKYLIILRTFPLLSTVVFLIVGQVLGMYLGKSSFLILVLISTALSRWIGISFKRIMLPIATLVLGYIGLVISYPGVPDFQLRQDTPYIAKIVGYPRYPKPGGVRFDLLVQPYKYPEDNENKSFQPVKLRCSGKDLPWRNTGQLMVGDTFIFQGKFTVIERSSNPCSYKEHLLRQGIFATCRIMLATKPIANQANIFQKAHLKIKNDLRSLVGNNEKSGLFLSMTIGTRDVISVNTERVFKTSGLTHLLVVSGYQVSLIFMVIFITFRNFILSLQIFQHTIFWVRLASVLSLVGSIFFVFMTGSDSSSMRALFSVIILFGLHCFERRITLLGSTLASLLATSFLAPGAIFDPGIQLTFAALFGICAALKKRSNVVLEYLKVNFYCYSFTATISCLWFKQFAAAGFLLNPILAPLLSIVSCIFGSVAYFFFILGVDSSGEMLKGIVSLITWSVELLRSFSFSELVFFDLRNIRLFWICLTSLVTVNSLIILFRLQRYLKLGR